MDRLRTCFEAFGFDRVETFIASGNVVFETTSTAVATMVRTIEKGLERELGYEVATFIRTDAEVAAVAVYQPFPKPAIASARAFSVGFLSAPLAKDGEKALMGLKTAIDDFHVHGREVYWLCRKGQSESAFSNVRFEKAAKVRATFRNMNTAQRLAAKYPPRRPTFRM